MNIGDSIKNRHTHRLACVVAITDNGLVYQYESLCESTGRGVSVHVRPKFMSCSIDRFNQLFVSPEVNTQRPPRVMTCGHLDRKYYCRGMCRNCYDRIRVRPDRSEYNKRVYRLNSTARKEAARKYAVDNQDRIMLQSARRHAMLKGVKFDLTLQDIRRVWVDTCPILGIKLVRGTGRRNENSPSLDRIHSDRGYEANNIHVISWRANRIKNDSTVQELEAIARYLRSMESR